MAPQPPSSPGGWRRLLGLVRGVTGPWTRGNAASWVVLVAVVLVLRWGFVELYSIPSGSMEPTLHGDPRFLHGDRVAVNKLLFGPRIPFTTVRLFRLGEPKRWDIVVFNAVEPNAPHKTLIKRVVGLPGERIHISDGRIVVNGVREEPPPELSGHLRYTMELAPSDDAIAEALLQLARSNALPPTANPAHRGVQTLEEDVRRLHDEMQGVSEEELSGEGARELVKGVAPVSLQIVKEWLIAEYGREKPFRFGIREEDEFSVVPEGHYFMLGDNSENSVDGRFFGWVPHENLYGRAFAVALPLSHRRDLSGFWSHWWGRGLLCGPPALIVLFESFRLFIVFSWRVRASEKGLGLVRGERLVVRRIGPGLRLPFAGRGLLWKREPQLGEVVAYLGGDDDGAGRGFCFGRVVVRDDRGGTRGGSGGRSARTIPVENATGTVEVHVDALIGRVVAVWWPFHRRRMLRSIEGEAASL